MGKKRSEIPDEDAGNPFISIGELLCKKISVATLATAIEKRGIYTWDRFGRFCICSKEDREPALNHLAGVHEWEMQRDGAPPGGHADQQHPVDASAGLLTPFSTYGWAKEVLPDFETIRQAQADVPQMPGTYTKNNRAPTLFVAALIGLLVEIAKRDRDFDIDAMPGTKTDFLELAKKHSEELEHPLSTFDTYLESLCKFKPGSRPGSGYYRKLFPEWFK